MLELGEGASAETETEEDSLDSHHQVTGETEVPRRWLSAGLYQVSMVWWRE